MYIVDFDVIGGDVGDWELPDVEESTRRVAWTLEIPENVFVASRRRRIRVEKWRRQKCFFDAPDENLRIVDLILDLILDCSPGSLSQSFQVSLSSRACKEAIGHR